MMSKHEALVGQIRGSAEKRCYIHKASGCRVDEEYVEEEVKAQNIRSRDGNGGWSMVKVALVSRCIIGA